MQHHSRPNSLEDPINQVSCDAEGVEQGAAWAFKFLKHNSIPLRQLSIQTTKQSSKMFTSKSSRIEREYLKASSAADASPTCGA